ncbi:hypothetical protein CPLU01_14000 [Colletotrichum plurivorum]|uniref:Uncharacterized protein n=1 Tax=Colletotrichum plurivorum TaxID=2175906 RepID=A0A8H6N1C7_9PEZI|nr:hypothetical protein CPLU01_14000 [Colletotrichum plurivorum]
MTINTFKEEQMKRQGTMQIETTAAAVTVATAGWLALGAVGYSPWAGQDLRVGLVFLFCFVQFVGFVVTGFNDAQAVYTAGAAIGVTITTLFFLLVNIGFQNAAQGFFWALSGLYLGLAGVFIAKPILERRRSRAETAHKSSTVDDYEC